MSESLRSALQKVSSEFAEETAEAWRETSMQRIRGANQGADGLAEHVTPIHESWDNDGSFQFKILHPTAALHEKGGHIEPTYAESMMIGWDRDGFYEALTDCNEFVTRKKLIRKARDDVRR